MVPTIRSCCNLVAIAHVFLLLAFSIELNEGQGYD